MKENKSAELSKMWMEAQELRAEGKNVNGLIENLEERLFSEADARIDAYWAEKKGLKPQVIPESPWEREYHETEKIVFEAKEKR
jgi:hypothetical protein